MKKVRIGINGFGRIGRLILRASLDFPNVEVVAVNDHSSNVDYMVYMLKYDTVHGKFDADVYVDNGYLVVNGKRIRVFNESEPSAIKWGGGKSRCGRRSDRKVHHYGKGGRTPGGRREKGCHNCAQCGRSHAHSGSKPPRLQARNQNHQQRKLHDQLSRAFGKGNQRQFRHCGGAYDHGALYDSHTAHGRRHKPQGLEGRTRRVGEYYSKLDGSRQGGGQGYSPTERQAHGNVFESAYVGRVCGRPYGTA